MNVARNLCELMARKNSDPLVGALDRARWTEIAIEIKLVKSLKLVRRNKDHFEFVRDPSKRFPRFAGPKWFMNHPDIHAVLRLNAALATRVLAAELDYDKYSKWEGWL